MHPPKPLRKWIINDDCCEPIAIYVKDKRNFKSALQGEDHFTANFIWKSFLKELAKDKYLLSLNPLGDRDGNDGEGSDKDDASISTVTDDDWSCCDGDGDDGDGNDDEDVGNCTQCLVPWQEAMKFALKDENRNRFCSLETPDYTNFVIIPCDLICNCDECNLVRAVKIFIPEPNMIDKVKKSRNWAFNHLIQSYIVILRHHYQEIMAEKHMLLVPGKLLHDGGNCVPTNLLCNS